MPLDPQARAFLDQMQEAGIRPAHELGVAAAREASIARRALVGGEAPPVARVEDRVIAGPAGELPLRVYTPYVSHNSPLLPVLVYFHGGGWVRGNLDTHDNLCRALAGAGECLVVSVDYRMAPEHTYPAAVDDCYAATMWVAAHAEELGGDADRLAVGGDSAGGNLAAAVTLMARDRSPGGAKIVHQVLIYPVTDYAFDTPSYRDNADGYMLTRADMQWYWQLYLGEGNELRAHEPYASPLRASDLTGLPPAHVITAEYDPLRDEGDAYARRLREVGVPVKSTCYPGMIHGFVDMAMVIDQGKRAVDDIGRELRVAFGRHTAETLSVPG